MNNEATWGLLGLIIGVWIYQDAKKRGIKDPIVWGLIGLLLGIIGLAGYWYWHIYGANTTKGYGPEPKPKAKSAAKSVAKPATKKAVAAKTTKKK